MCACVLVHVWCVGGAFVYNLAAWTGCSVAARSLKLSRRVHSGKWGCRVTVVQEFQKSKKGERVVHKMQLAVSLDTETGFRKSPQVP